MNISLKKSSIAKESSIKITGSKSESNRLLLLQALYPSIKILNVSNSDDSILMQKALKSTSSTIDIHHAGTAMRFLTAYFSLQQDREVVLTGSARMHERPIKILVDALKDLGADISYLKNEGFPPLSIQGKTLSKYKVTLAANVSSQYISALLLVAPKLEKGLALNLEGKITSVPYIQMTLNLLEQIGVETSFRDNVIIIKPKTHNPEPKTLVVESDWSSASYFYSIVALSTLGTKITLSSYKKNSLQGDAVLSTIYKQFGVETTYQETSITLTKTSNQVGDFKYNLSNAPDIAQTITVTCLGLGIACHLTGLHTLKIKETDRLVALKNEIEKFGTEVSITNNSLTISKINPFTNNVYVKTYHDHRMAMAFAPLALKVDFNILEADVVSKSYPDFWNDLQNIGFKFSNL
ncbi:3-phosphoshikimate 1-carboxyvinyltransferase [Pontimicrobium aquaticum]|uniref:3-phosphoshikimate 1-carboxyvinyltransferase n=1 Tax=Pontimicrobium aquaticum TaxID=2565367 RepID=A0A4U0EYA9_9FLAO|nr:3-phosphoshikimate 1-carboxyvinyltransferase [Pontimicrobium aquaticum]TJY36996.1 3-phosphoshikimate 1-carboxyvinyltransferase [Pontimicrobium aquaticum]